MATAKAVAGVNEVKDDMAKVLARLFEVDKKIEELNTAVSSSDKKNEAKAKQTAEQIKLIPELCIEVPRVKESVALLAARIGTLEKLQSDFMAEVQQHLGRLETAHQTLADTVSSLGERTDALEDVDMEDSELAAAEAPAQAVPVPFMNEHAFEDKGVTAAPETVAPELKAALRLPPSCNKLLKVVNGNSIDVKKVLEVLSEAIDYAAAHEGKFPAGLVTDVMENQVPPVLARCITPLGSPDETTRTAVASIRTPYGLVVALQTYIDKMGPSLASLTGAIPKFSCGADAVGVVHDGLMAAEYGRVEATFEAAWRCAGKPFREDGLARGQFVFAFLRALPKALSLRVQQTLNLANAAAVPATLTYARLKEVTSGLLNQMLTVEALKAELVAPAPPPNAGEGNRHNAGGARAPHAASGAGNGGHGGHGGSGGGGDGGGAKRQRVDNAAPASSSASGSKCGVCGQPKDKAGCGNCRTGPHHHYDQCKQKECRFGKACAKGDICKFTH